MLLVYILPQQDIKPSNFTSHKQAPEVRNRMFDRSKCLGYRHDVPMGIGIGAYPQNGSRLKPTGFKDITLTLEPCRQPSSQ